MVAGTYLLLSSLCDALWKWELSWQALPNTLQSKYGTLPEWFLTILLHCIVCASDLNSQTYSHSWRLHSCGASAAHRPQTARLWSSAACCTGPASCGRARGRRASWWSGSSFEPVEETSMGDSLRLKGVLLRKQSGEGTMGLQRQQQQ